MVSKPTIGFIGLGRLGTALAEMILQETNKLMVWSPNSQPSDFLVKNGAQQAATIEQLTRTCNWVFTCVSDDTSLMDVSKHIHTHGEHIDVHISMTTASPSTSCQLSDTMKELGIDFVACPVLGRPDVVRKRAATYLLGGASPHMHELLGLIERLGSVTHIGPKPEDAVGYKLLVNYMIAGMIGTFSEATAASYEMSLLPEKLLEILMASPMGCKALSMFATNLLSGQYKEPLFKTSLAHKDVRYLQDASKNAHSLPILGAIESVMQDGNPNLDWSGYASDLIKKSADL